MSGHRPTVGSLFGPRGRELLANRYRNKGTAFTAEERDLLGLNGLLPPVIETLETQLRRTRGEYDGKSTDLDRHIYLRLLQQRNTVLFYRFLADNLAETLPIVYTPTVGLACQEWSRIYRREQGLYVSIADRGRVGELVDNALDGFDKEVTVVVVTDGQRILGLGDLGVGGMGIPIGKLALYSAVGGVDPATTLPITIDVGTDNETLLSDPLYLGRRHSRVQGAEYDELIDELVAELADRCPGVLLQWEDFAQQNAGRTLARHRDAICSFNDDIQGTAAIAAAAVIAGMQINTLPVAGLRTVIVGAGSAGIGIANQLVATMIREGVDADIAQRQVYLIDRDGLLQDSHSMLPFQEPFARRAADLDGWTLDGDGNVRLAEVVRRVKPHALIGVTGQPGLFTEEVIREMGQHVARPIVLPLSNPTPRCEAIPEDVLRWTQGRALIGTGSPFAPVDYAGTTYRIAQVNNVYVFPGLGLGVIASGATKITDEMITVASLAVADYAATEVEGPAALVPPIQRSGEVARRVAIAIAMQAVREGVAPEATEEALTKAVDAAYWSPAYD